MKLTPTPGAPEPHRLSPVSPTRTTATLDDRMLLAMIVERAGADHDPERLAAALLERFGTLGGLASAPPGELVRAFSAGHAIQAELMLLQDFAVRLARAEACRRAVITSWTALVAYVRAALAHEPREQFRTLFLDRRNILLRDELAADGTVDHAPVYNAGPARVARLGRIPDIAETQSYVVTVVDCYLALTAGQGVTDSSQCGSREAGR